MVKTEECERCEVSYFKLSPDRECPICHGEPIEEDKEDGDEEEEKGSNGLTHLEVYGPHWSEVRKEILERDDYRCQHEGCGLTHREHKNRDDLFPPGKGLHIHHKIPARDFDTWEEAHEDSNLITLCDTHHKLRENGQL